MTAPVTTAFALHVEAAKRLLLELEQQAEVAREALAREENAQFLAAVEERDLILKRLDEVVEAIAHERTSGNDESAERDAETERLLADMAQAAASALESHEQLESATKRERDRLARAQVRSTRPDAVADHYAASTTGPRQRTLSVKG
jgi:hypothetical protein